MEKWNDDPEAQWRLWKEHLEVWPRERLRTMSLEEYTKAGDMDCFVNRLESGLQSLGSIWGGSAFKFGIYSRKSSDEKESGGGLSYTKEYAWYSKYGSTAQEAFESVKTIINGIVDAAAEGRIADIEHFDLGNTIKWKIAFLYQSRDKVNLIPVYSRTYLVEYLGKEWASKKQSEVYIELSRMRGDRDIFQFGADVFNSAQASMEKKGLTPERAYQFLSDRYVLRAGSSKKMAGFATSSGRDLALELTTKSVSLYVEPIDWLVPGMSVKKVFKPDDTRHSNIGARAPRIALGRPACLIGLTTLAALQEFCDRYDESPLQAEDSPTVTERMEHMGPSDIPLNQILYGPPGTGKTYATVNRALEILDPEYLAARREDRAALKRRFDELVSSQRVRFVTFHQSFSYEDFVEGIRAKTVDGALVYQEEPGVFKELCEDARSRVVQRSAEVIDPAGRRIWKMSLGNTLEDDDIFDDCRENGYVLLGWGQDIDFTEARNRRGVLEAFKAQGREPRSDYEVTAVDMFRNRVSKGDLVVVSDGNHKFRGIAEVTGDYEFMPDLDHYKQGRTVKWHQVYSPSRPTATLMNNKIFSQRTIYELRSPSLDMEKLEKLLAESTVNDTEASDAGNWVLIIDEINRGNVSRIFGELITLIEPNKRAGKPEALSTILPYSKEPFEVPSNVYLIGTMNTADRSLATLDIALRRRFVFEEVAPDPSVLVGVTVEGVAIGKLMGAMNERIEALLDRDHCLGHSYLLPLKSNPTLTALRDIFKRQIVPLLQEYFFDDWRRIQWVLNDHRKPDAYRFVIEREPDSSAFDDGDIALTRNGHWTLNESAFSHIESYRGIIRASE